MTTKLPSQAVPAAHKVLNFAGPALVLGLVLVSYAQARIRYPSGPAGTVERAVDNILIKERVDILRQDLLVTRQNQLNVRLGFLQQQQAQATDPRVIAALQRQIAQGASQFRSLQVAIDRNATVLRNDLLVLNPQKDRALLMLSNFPRPRHQIAQFIQSASLQQSVYATVMRAFLSRRPLSPIFAF